VRADTGAVLYSKVKTGQHLVDSAPQLDAFVASLKEQR
jgi:hypothetical protein